MTHVGSNSIETFDLLLSFCHPSCTLISLSEMTFSSLEPVHSIHWRKFKFTTQRSDEKSFNEVFCRHWGAKIKYLQVFKVISYKESLKWIKVFKDPSIHTYINFSNKYLDLYTKTKKDKYLDLPIAKMLLEDKRTSSGRLKPIKY